MVLGAVEEAPVTEIRQPEVKLEEAPAVMIEAKPIADPMMPVLVEEIPVAAPVIDFTDLVKAESEPEIFELDMTMGITAQVVEMKTEEAPQEIVPEQQEMIPPSVKQTDAELIYTEKTSTGLGSAPAAAGGYLARPSNIYAESKAEEIPSMSSVEKPVPEPKVASVEQEELLDLQMQLVERDDIPAADMPMAHLTQTPLASDIEDLPMADEMEEQKRRAAERLNKLRNLSFNVNSADPNNEFETVPAYIRRNMELYNNNTQVENFYSSYEVKPDNNNKVQISSINTFLEGKKPD